MQNIKLSLNFQFNLPEGLLKYLLNMDPSQEWKARGLTGHNRDLSLQEQINLYLRKKISKLTPEQQTRLALFLKNAYQIFLNLFHLQIPDKLRNKDFYFVIGFMRTGGTYLLTELCKIFHIDYKSLHMSFIYDDIPQYYLCKNSYIGFLFVNLLFELSLWINWLMEQWSTNKPIIKKRIAFAYIIRMLDDLFQGKATFLITIRDPIHCAYSFANLEKIDIFSCFSPEGWLDSVKKFRRIEDEQWKNLPYLFRAIFFWESYYMTIAYNFPTKGKLLPICFGQEMLDFLYQLAQKEKNYVYRPSKFVETTYRDIPKEAQERAFEAISRVKEAWKLHNIKFPL